MTINEVQDELIEDFDLFDEQLDKTQYIIDPEKYLDDEHLIKGCQSKVWLGAEFRDNKIYFYADAEPTAQISKGLVSLLIKVLSGRSPEEIVNADLYIIQRVGMGSLITSLRSGGLASMIQKMKYYGNVYSNLLEK
jgi:cysteine desulfuration protein SufE